LCDPREELRREHVETGGPRLSVEQDLVDDGARLVAIREDAQCVDRAREWSRAQSLDQRIEHRPERRSASPHQHELCSQTHRQRTVDVRPELPRDLVAAGRTIEQCRDEHVHAAALELLDRVRARHRERGAETAEALDHDAPGEARIADEEVDLEPKVVGGDCQERQRVDARRRGQMCDALC
jgi:hypothetical protein